MEVSRRKGTGTGRQRIGQEKDCQICVEKIKGEKNIGERTGKAEKDKKRRERGGRSLVTRAGDHPGVHHRDVDPGPQWRVGPTHSLE